MQGQQRRQHAGQQADCFRANLATGQVLGVRQSAVSLFVQLPLLWIGPELTSGVMDRGQSNDTHHSDEDAPDQPGGFHDVMIFSCALYVLPRHQMLSVLMSSIGKLKTYKYVAIQIAS